MFRGGHMEYRASGPLLQLYHVTHQVTLARDLAIDTMFADLGYIIIIIATSGLATCFGLRDSHPWPLHRYHPCSDGAVFQWRAKSFLVVTVMDVRGWLVG
jgi:hypothetical protein